MENKLSEFLINYRKEHDMSLREFSDKLGFSHSYLSKLESGIDPRSNKPVSPTIDTLNQIANATNMDLGKILEISGYKVGETLVNNDGSTTTDYFPPKPVTLAAHLEGEGYTPEQIDRIEAFARFVKSDIK